MEKANKTPTNFSTIQNVLAGIACSFYLIYKFYLVDEKIIRDLGAAYPWFIMGWVIIMLVSAGLSGSKLVQYVIKYAPLISKAISSVKKDIKNE